MLRELITINPRSAVRSNPRKKRKHGARKHRAVRRNPRFKLQLPKLADVTSAVLPAAIGGGGALALDIVIGQLSFIPPEWKTGHRRTLLRAGVAFAAGFLARSVLPGKWKTMADKATAGALTVTAYDAAKAIVAEKFPELTLGMYDGDLSAYERVSYDALPVLQSRSAGGGVNAYVPAELGMLPAVR